MGKPLCERSVACLKVLSMLLREASRSRSARIMGALAATLVVTCWQIAAGTAQTCGSEYLLKEGDTLAQIATRAYGDPAQWTIILYANQDRLEANQSSL